MKAGFEMKGENNKKMPAEKHRGRAGNRLGEAPVFSLLVRLSLPAIFSMLVQALYNVVDSIYVGHLSKDALAALSLAFPIQLVLIAIGVGTGVGTGSLIARLLGAGKQEGARRSAEQALFLALVYSLAFAAVGFLISDRLIGFFTDQAVLVDLGSRYIRIILLGSAGMFIPMIANSILRGEGNTFLPMVSMLIGSILNMILDPLFIFGFGAFGGFGIEGAALATVLSRILSGIYILYVLYRGGNQIVPRIRGFRLEAPLLGKIYAVGLPAIVMQVLASFMIGGMNLIVGRMDANAVAALGIYFKLQSFVFMPVFGLNQGYMPIVGYNYGHGSPERMKRAMRYGFATAAVFTTAGFVLFQTAAPLLVSLFDADQALMAVGTDALRTISLAFPIIGPAILVATTFQALGRGFPSLVLSFSRQIILLLPLAWVFSRTGSLESVWYAFPISEGIMFLVALFWLGRTLGKVFGRMEEKALGAD